MTPGQPFKLSQALPQGVTPDDLYTLLAAVLSFLVILAIGGSFTRRDKMAPRLKAIQQRRAELKGQYSGPRRRKKRANEPHDWMRILVGRVKVVKAAQLQRVALKMVQAGYRSKDAVIVYSFCKLVMPIAAFFIGLILLDIQWSLLLVFDTTQLENLGGLALITFIGVKLPDILLSNKRTKRYHRIRRGLADTLDLLLICAEAGLSLTAALDRVARELGQAYPDMAEELSMTSVEIGFLPERNTALKHLAERVDIQEMRSIVNILLQTEKYGTPVAQALRIMSREFRTERMLRAEQKAARLPAIMTVPMIIFILPTMFIIVLTPAIIMVMNTK